jgi:hypothetical protein
MPFEAAPSRRRGEDRTPGEILGAEIEFLERPVEADSRELDAQGETQLPLAIQEADHGDLGGELVLEEDALRSRRPAPVERIGDFELDAARVELQTEAKRAFGEVLGPAGEQLQPPVETRM